MIHRVSRSLVVVCICIAFLFSRSTFVGLDTTENIVKLSNKEDLKYDYLFACTGSKPRMPSTPGKHLKNIFVLRDYTDARDLHSILTPEKHVVVMGLGFIGMEAAAYCIDKCASVTVVGRNTVPLQVVFGSDIGNRIKREFEEKGKTGDQNHRVHPHHGSSWVQASLDDNNPFFDRCKVHFQDGHQTVHRQGGRGKRCGQS